MSAELKPCPVPWCNNPEPVAKTSLPAASPKWRFIVACSSCGLVTNYFQTRAEAIDAWNTRPSASILAAARKVADAMRKSDLPGADYADIINVATEARNLAALLPAERAEKETK